MKGKKYEGMEEEEREGEWKKVKLVPMEEKYKDSEGNRVEVIRKMLSISFLPSLSMITTDFENSSLVPSLHLLPLSLSFSSFLSPFLILFLQLNSSFSNPTWIMELFL